MSDQASAGPYSQLSEYDRPLNFGADGQMSPMDTLLWRGDSDRHHRGTLSMLEIYDCVPDWDRLVAAHEWGSRMLPRLRQRVVDSPLGTGIPSWVVDPEFDLHYHVRRLRLAGDGSIRELLTTCEQLAMTALDPERSPWEVYLIDGLPDGRGAYLLKAHQALTGAMSSISILAQLHSRQREPLPGKPQPPAPTPSTTGAVVILVRQLSHEVQRAPHRIDLAIRGAMALADPRKALSQVLRFGRSVPRVAGLISPPGSPLLAERSLSWRFAAVEVPFAAIEAASAEIRASVDEVYLGGLVSGLRLYHQRLGQPVEAIPVAVPIVVRDPDNPNETRVSIGRLAGPTGIDDPFERVLTVREQIRAARNEPAVNAFHDVGPMLAWLPGQVVGQFSGATTRNDLQASNVGGIEWESYVAGAKVERMFAFGPLPGCAIMATMVTYNGTSCIGINYDAAAVTDPELFAESVVDGFNEVLALSDTVGRMTRFT